MDIMAMLDKMSFLIEHIRNSFITSDDTGMCEVVIDCEGDYAPNKKDMLKKQSPKTEMEGAECNSEDDNSVISDSELSHSYDIMPDMDLVGHRRRSYTAQRLDKLKRDREMRSKVQHVPWKDKTSADVAVDGTTDFFEKRTVVPVTVCSTNRKSALSSHLAQVDSAPNNPFAEYSKFDGRSSTGVAVKNLSIFLTMAFSADRPYPISVVTLSSAKILQLIGLICWQYTKESRTPALHDTVNYYALHIAEDDGEVDMDFPALDINEPISKFGFAKLALVEREIPITRRMSSMVVTIHMPGRGFSRIPIENENILMKELLGKVLERRKIKDTGIPYRLEKLKEPGESVDLEKALSAMTTLDFCVLRENSMRADVQAGLSDESASDDIYSSLCSPQYKCFNVVMIQKVGRNIEIQLGVSGEKIEVDPTSKSRGIFGPKATSYNINSIVMCHLLEKEKRSSTHGDKSMLRLVYQMFRNDDPMQDVDYHHLDFEASASVAREIMTKVNNILELRFSKRKDEYETHMDKKRETSGRSRILKSGSFSMRRNTINLGMLRRNKSKNQPPAIDES